MRAVGSSFHAWELLERQEGVQVPHGLVFPLAVVASIGRPHGLELTAEEHTTDPVASYDAVLISVLDARCLVNAGRHFAGWAVPLRRRDRPHGRWPVVIAGGQGIHNPMPVFDVADVIVVGDAEGPLPGLLDLWHTHQTRRGFLDDAARLDGVIVPQLHDPASDRVAQSVAADITTTLYDDIRVSNDGSRRVEIARGCRYKCTFCSLGWRAPLRENTAGQVADTIKESPRRVHLQAGDAESHSGIDEIRVALRQHGGHDQGWTGRLDTLFENPDQTIPGQKRYAFGVEGVSWRLRRAVGKRYLTDDRLTEDTARFFAQIGDDETRGRAAWHMIAGLPTERPAEIMDLDQVVRRIDHARRGQIRRNLALHWQPFCPLPGTPMQWSPVGGGARRHASMLSGLTRLPWVGVRHVVGRTDRMAQLTTIIARSDRACVDLLDALTSRDVTPGEAEQITGTTAGQLDPDAPLPWDWIDHAYPRDALTRAYRTMCRLLDEGEPCSTAT